MGFGGVWVWRSVGAVRLGQVKWAGCCEGGPVSGFGSGAKSQMSRVLRGPEANASVMWCCSPLIEIEGISVLEPTGMQSFLFAAIHPPCTTRYYNELWVLHLDELKWSVPALPAGGQAWPSARSGCQVSVNGDTMFVYGGYSKVSQGGGRHAGIDGILNKNKR